MCPFAHCMYGAFTINISKAATRNNRKWLPEFSSNKLFSIYFLVKYFLCVLGFSNRQLGISFFLTMMKLDWLLLQSDSNKPDKNFRVYLKHPIESFSFQENSPYQESIPLYTAYEKLIEVKIVYMICILSFNYIGIVPF